jgi:hypothetical protein
VQQGWRIDLSLYQQFNTNYPWQILFSDGGLGQFIAYAAEAISLGGGMWHYPAPGEMVTSMANVINTEQGIGLSPGLAAVGITQQQDKLNLVVFTYGGDASNPGSAFITVAQVPFSGNTNVSAWTGSPGTITVSPWYGP